MKKRISGLSQPKSNLKNYGFCKKQLKKSARFYLTISHLVFSGRGRKIYI